MQDRTYYRGFDRRALLSLAKSEGINPEMALVLAEFLAASRGVSEYFFRDDQNQTGQFHFNPHYSKETSK